MQNTSILQPLPASVDDVHLLPTKRNTSANNFTLLTFAWPFDLLAKLKNNCSLCRFVFVFIFVIIASCTIQAQTKKATQDSTSLKPLIVNLSEDGKRYVRFIMWNQIWLSTNDLKSDNLQVTPSIRRARFLAYSQISPRVLILTHFGTNGITPQNLSAFGNGENSPRFFLHSAWGELKINDALYVGTGLHYWNGLTRLASASTTSFITLDQARPFSHWHALGVTDQYARNLGVYTKGQLGKFDYRIAVNTPNRNPLNDGMHYGTKDAGLEYSGVNHKDKNGNIVGTTIIEGYFRYNFWDSESTKLPYQKGTYLGKKKILGIGTGFYFHPNGMYSSDYEHHQNVSHFAVDAFMEYPNGIGDVIHAYASYTNFNYGNNFVSRWAGTGSNLYAQVGYLVKPAKLMPYLAVQRGDYEGFDEPINSIDVGANYFINGHNCKITLEYHRIKGDIREATIINQGDALSQLRFQLQLFY